MTKQSRGTKQSIKRNHKPKALVSEANTKEDKNSLLCKQVGFNKMVIWGLFVSRRWPVPLARAVNTQRRKQIQELLDAAHKRGIQILSGLGVFARLTDAKGLRYSWGFEEIIEKFPKVSKRIRGKRANEWNLECGIPLT